MIISAVREQIGNQCKRGIVFAAGGSADIILAKNIAAGLVRWGCAQVDLAQPLNCKRLSDKGLLAEQVQRYALETEAGLDPEAVLRHHSTIPAERHLDSVRGKGLSISSSLQWNYGSRYVCAAHGRGLSMLAARRDGDLPYYDFALGVDGGGDVLTHDDAEFDRIVVRGFRANWPSDRPLLLVSMGLGADGGSLPAEFRRVSLDGWKSLPSVTVDEGFSQSLQRDLELLGLWHPAPSAWSPDDPYWGYGLKVPQIIALAVRNEFPFGGPDDDSALVLFPRRRELKLMDRRLLREARLFLREGEQ